MKIPGLRSGITSLFLLSLLVVPAGAQGTDEAQEMGRQPGPGPVPVDAFHPAVVAGEPQPDAAYGGRIIVHLPNMPRTMNHVIDNSAVISWMQFEVCDTLIAQDWETWEYVPRLAERYEVEDTVILKPEAAEKYGAAAVTIGSGEQQRSVLFGATEAIEGGWRVTGSSPAHPHPEAVTVATEDVLSVERGTVFTFVLREGVPWHDGHVLDAYDVYFSWDVYNNRFVDCEELASQYRKIYHGEILDARTVRFFYEQQYFKAIDTVGTMPLIPRHLFDLTDPDNVVAHPEVHEAYRAEHGAEWTPTPEQCGAFVNENPHNSVHWIGTGPYRITAWAQQYIEAERFADYWDADDPRSGGYLDTIRWRYIGDDAAKNALIQGELDLFTRIRSEDYFGEFTQKEAFTDRFYKGYYDTGSWNYTSWNLYRPIFQQPEVRHALGHAFDTLGWVKTEYKGLGVPVTGPQNYFGPGYDHDILPLAYDLERAETLFAEAGWYDRDGDGVIDKDGIPFTFEFMCIANNTSSHRLAAKYQESLSSIGVLMKILELDYATLIERVLERNFDAVTLAWVPPLESDPEQLWHSEKGKRDVRSSNRAGLMDPKVDELIAAGQREIDLEKRSAIWRELHARIFELQPYLFGISPPRKFAINKEIRGLQTFVIPPGYSLRRLYYAAGTPGTRTTPQ